MESECTQKENCFLDMDNNNGYNINDNGYHNDDNGYFNNNDGSTENSDDAK